jgi:signal transduction histidine kinase
MRSVLDENDLPLTLWASETFNKALKKQENNITEHGEREATGGVRKEFSLLIDPAQNLIVKQHAERNIRSLLKTIDGLNMRAIVLKNDATHETVNKAALYLGGMAFITFLVLFILVANFPGFITDPLNEFTEALQEITKKNYGTRLSFKTSQEFAQLADAFNVMAARLSETENTNLTAIVSEGLRIKTLIEEMHEAVIGLNEKQEILFINTKAKKILNLDDKPVIGQSVPGLLKNNNLLKTIVDNKHPDHALKVHLDGKVSYFQQRNFEIVAPNLKLAEPGTLQFAGYSAGMIYILRSVTDQAEVNTNI